MTRIEKGAYPFSQNELFLLTDRYTIYQQGRRILLVENDDPNNVIEVSPSGVIYGNSLAELRKPHRRLKK